VARKARETIASLADKAGLDVDDTLITLWEEGLETYTAATDVLRGRDLETARTVLGLATRRQVTHPLYWQQLLGLDDPEWADLLKKVGVSMGRKARRLPKGAVAKLRRVLASRALVNPARPVIDDVVASVAPKALPLEWKVVGRERDLRFLTTQEVIGIHEELVVDFAGGPDPIDPPGVASNDLVESAVFRQHTAFAGISKYPSAEMAAGTLMHAIVHDHPFFNGNKRTALVAMIVLLDENGIMLTSAEEDLFKFVLQLAQHRIVKETNNLTDREVLHVAEWIFRQSRNIEKGDRPVQWRRLKQILRSFDAHCETARGTGNRLNITRTVPVRALGLLRERQASTQVSYTDDGREATVAAVKKIRKDLQLDEEHGIDSVAFYSRSGLFPGQFIAKYRKTLQRLARL
jgi:death-on-curing family protein